MWPPFEYQIKFKTKSVMNIYILQSWTDEGYPHITDKISLADCLTLLEYAEDKNKQRNFKIRIISPFYV